MLERRKDLCVNGLRNTIETCGLQALRPQLLQNMLTSSDIIRFGTRLNLMTETHTGTPVGLNKPFKLDFTLTISIGIAELKFQKGGCLRSNSTTADRYHSGLVREQLLVRTMRIEILQSLTTTARIEMHQSQTATLLLTMRHSQSISSPDERTSSKRSKRRDPHPCDNIVRQTINKLSFQTTMNNIFRNNAKVY